MAELVEARGWMRVRALRSRLKLPWVRVSVSLLLTGLLVLGAMIGPFEDMGGSARIALALFALAAIFWMTEVVPLYVTSLIILALQIVVLVPELQAEGIEVGEEAFMAPFFSNVTLLFLGGLLLAQAGGKHRLDTWFATRLVGWAGGRPAHVLLAMMGASAFLSMWMSNTATTAMMLILAVALARQLPKDARGFRKALFLGVPFACNLGGLGTPIGTPPNAIAVSLLESRGEAIGFLSWMAISAPLLIVLLLLLWRLLLRAFPPPDMVLAMPPGGEKLPSGWKPRATLVVFAAAVLAWLTGPLHGLSSGNVALLAAVVLLATNILDSKDFRGISWDVLFLVGGGLALGVSIEVSGLAAWLTTHLALDTLGDVAILGGFIAAGAILTTFMSNTATANMLMPLALSLPVEHAPLLAAIAMATSTSMALPVSTPPNAIAYYSGEVEIREMMRHGVVISAISAALIFAAALTFWSWIDLG